jgi:hypothetical protein
VPLRVQISAAVSRLNAYLNMANDLQNIGRHDRLYALAILSGVVIASLLRIPADSLGEWRYDTLLIPGERIHAGGQTIADRIFGGILAARADALYKSRDQMSERQRAKLRDARDVDWEQVAASRQGRALIRDHLNQKARDADESG